MKWKVPEFLKPDFKSVSTVIGIVVGTLVVVYGILMWWWDTELDMFDVVDAAADHAGISKDRLVTGYVTASTVREMATKLLDKRGGYLSNDLFPPGVLMDNIPNWEFGALVQIRDMARALRLDLSRSQSQSIEDKDLSEAEGKFFYDNSSWIFPASESQYKEGIELLDEYLKRLQDPTDSDAQFYSRADNLRNWLTGVSTRLGSLAQRLSQSVGKNQLNLATAGDRSATIATTIPEDQHVRTSWFEIDDVFYEARGQAWALVHLLRAIEHDFAPVLEDKNALVSLRQIIRDLEATQASIWSPVILNGGGFGLLANHSLVMASYISSVNAAVIDLEHLLAQG